MNIKEKLIEFINSRKEAELESLFKEIVKPDKNKEMSDFLFEMFNKVDKFRITGEKETTYYIGNDWLFQQDYKNGYLWIRYSLIWLVFESKIGLNHEQIRNFINSWIETNIGWKGLTPRTSDNLPPVLIETNIGWKGLIPLGKRYK